MIYLLLLIPVCLSVISYRYKLKYQKYKNSGKVPVILEARANTTVFFLLALASVFIIFLVMINYTNL